MILYKHSDIPFVLTNTCVLHLSELQDASSSHLPQFSSTKKGNLLVHAKWKSWVDLPLGMVVSSTSLEGIGTQSLQLFTSMVAQFPGSARLHPTSNSH